MNKHFLLALVGAIAGFGTITFAQDEAGACAAIDDDLARLACYDLALGRSPSPDPTPVTHWDVRSTKSDFTDQTDVYISTLADGPVQCTGGNTPFLFVRCLEGETTVFISHGCYAPVDHETGRLVVQLRVDDEPTRTKRLYTATDDKSFGWWDHKGAMSEIRDTLLDHDTWVVRFSPYRDVPQIARFNISGLREVMKSTEPSCDWGDLAQQD